MPLHIATWNPARVVWETPTLSLLCAHSEPYSETWPSSGMTRSGEAYRRLEWELLTEDSACSSSRGLPSPPPDEEEIRTLPTPDAYAGERGGYHNPAARKAAGHSIALSDVAVAVTRGDDPDDLDPFLLPTPVVTDSVGARNSTSRSAENPRKGATGDTLTDALCPRPGDQPNAASRRRTRPVVSLVDDPLLPTPDASAHKYRLGGDTQQSKSLEARSRRGELGDEWGPYGPAIERWSGVLDRDAPPWTETNRRGDPRLAAPFAEWMMGLEPGHVTGVPGVDRAAQLKALGNGVVPQQATEGFRRILAANPHVLDALLDRIPTSTP